MKRENRYLVIKWEDIDKHLSATQKSQLSEIREEIYTGRSEEGKDETEYVVVGSDWPMYEQTWEAIEKWVDGTEAMK